MRRLARAPGFTIVAALTVAVAVAPSLLFRLVDRAVLPPLPFERSEELLAVWQRASFGKIASSYPKLRYLQEHSRTTEVAIFKGLDLFPTMADSTVRLHVEPVTPNVFQLLGARPLLGRVFRPDENQTPLGHPVVVLSEKVWRERYGARPDVLTEKMVLNGVPFSVIGVMPAEWSGVAAVQWRWAGAQPADGWIPAMMAPLGLVGDWATARAIETPYATIWCGIARLRPGHDLRAARAEAHVLGQQVRSLWPEQNEDFPVPFDLIPLNEDAVDPKLAKAVFMLQVAGILVLLLGALNLGNMFLARGADRSRTMSLLAVLGASRFGLAFGALAEALVVAAAGAALGVLLTRAALLGLGLVEPTILTAPFGVTFDPAGFQIDASLGLMALGFSIVAAVGAALVPAWRTTRIDASAFLRGGTGITRGGLGRLRITRPSGLLVVAEVAFALALTLPALLLVRSVGRLVGADLGFATRGVTTAELRLPSLEYPPESAASFVEQALERLRATRAVESASWMNGVPLADNFFTSEIRSTTTKTHGFLASVHVVSPEAFRTLAITLQRGRDFGPEDGARGPAVAILSEDGARLLGGEPLGARVDVRTLGGRTIEIVGVAGNVPYRDLAKERIPAIYLPLTQMPLADGALVVRSAGTTQGAAALLRDTIASLDPRLRMTAIEALADRTDRAVARFRGATWLLGMAAGLALCLSGIGIYGLLSSLVAQSVPEIGVRIALGAPPAAIARLVAGSSLLPAAVGLIIGAALGSWGATYLEGHLYEIRRYDLPSLLVALVTAAALAIVAALQPARRASRVDPVVALRSE